MFLLSTGGNQKTFNMDLERAIKEYKDTWWLFKGLKNSGWNDGPYGPRIIHILEIYISPTHAEDYKPPALYMKFNQYDPDDSTQGGKPYRMNSELTYLPAQAHKLSYEEAVTYLI